MMMPVLQQELGWSVRGRWAGPRRLVDGTGGCRIVYGGVESLHVDLQAPTKNTSLQKTRKKRGRRGLGPWPLRCLSQTLFERKERVCR